jgi:hypothetical protein
VTLDLATELGTGLAHIHLLGDVLSPGDAVDLWDQVRPVFYDAAITDVVLECAGDVPGSPTCRAFVLFLEEQGRRSGKAVHLTLPSVR